LHLLYGLRDRTLGPGALLGLSGTRLLTRTRGHLVVADLVHGRRVDETTRHGAVAAALSGRYLSYLHADGSVWRLDLDQPGRRPVQLAAAFGRGAATGRVYSWGDWTAWTIQPTGAGAAVSQWRNGRTLAPARQLTRGLIYGASVTGPIVGTDDPQTFRLIRWTTGAELSALPGRGVPPSVDGATVGWLRNGVPTIAAVDAAVRNRPRALGSASARHGVTAGRRWRLELPTSAVLTRCTVTVRHGRYRRTLRCGPAWQARGDVLVHWRTGGASRGRYIWTIHAANADGSLLRSTGRDKAPRGTVRVTRP
jgi:hypothetical protein